MKNLNVNFRKVAKSSKSNVKVTKLQKAAKGTRNIMEMLKPKSTEEVRAENEVSQTMEGMRVLTDKEHEYLILSRLPWGQSHSSIGLSSNDLFEMDQLLEDENELDCKEEDVENRDIEEIKKTEER